MYEVVSVRRVVVLSACSCEQQQAGGAPGVDSRREGQANDVAEAAALATGANRGVRRSRMSEQSTENAEAAAGG